MDHLISGGGGAGIFPRDKLHCLTKAGLRTLYVKFCYLQTFKAPKEKGFEKIN